MQKNYQFKALKHVTEFDRNLLMTALLSSAFSLNSCHEFCALATHALPGGVCRDLKKKFGQFYFFLQTAL